jgi:hypothetical protein
MKRDIIQTAIGICAIIGIALGALSYFAKAEDLHLVEMRLESKIIADQIYQLQSRLWQIEDRNQAYGPDCSRWPQLDRQEYRDLRTKLDDLKAKQNMLMQRGKW